MAKKKVTTTVEETDVPEVNYDDIHKKDMDKVIADTPVVEENPIEKKVKETKDTPTDVKEEEDEGIEFDPEKLKKEAADDARKAIIDALQGQSEDKTKENINEYDKFAKDTWEKEGRNPTYAEALKFVGDIVRRDLVKEQEEKTKVEEERKASEAKTAEEQQKSFNEFVDRELEDLYGEGKLPRIKTPVKNEKDPNDPGLKDPGYLARKALFQTMLDVNTKLQAEGKPIEYSIYKIFTKYHKANKQPAGADAPVSGGTTGGAGVDEGGKIDYREIKRKTWFDLLHGK